MRSSRLAAVLAAALLSPAVCADDESLLAMFRSDDPAQITAAAQQVSAAGAATQEVLDVMAELALVRAQSRERRHRQDDYLKALNWVCRAVGETGGGRYFEALKLLGNNRHVEKPVRKWCKQGARAIRHPDGEQYLQGMASLDPATAGRPVPAPRSTAVGAAPRASTPAPAPRPAEPVDYRPLSELKVGMSYEQAIALVGPPTSMGGHVTGKSWIPFNYKGGDTYRTIAYYKGQGRVVFSNVSRYSQAKSVAEVQLDAGEGGYH